MAGGRKEGVVTRSQLELRQMGLVRGGQAVDEKGVEELRGPVQELETLPERGAHTVH